MKVLVIGGGGREHALTWGLHKSSLVHEIWTSSKNAGICQLAKCTNIEDAGVKALADWAEAEGIDLTVVGPEAQLSVGIVDEFQSRGLAIFGPRKAAARLEWSKAFAKELMARHNIPTARFALCNNAATALGKARSFGLPVVIKADGLAAGKGVSVCFSWREVESAIDRIMQEKVFGEAGEWVVVEEFLTGEEASVHAIATGTDYLLLPAAQDHKTVFEGDKGANTGGMGSYSPAPVANAAIMDDVTRKIIRPTLEAMAAEGDAFTGALYVGLMINETGPKVVEYNCRFGDPETQALIPRLKSDLAQVLLAAAKGDISQTKLRWSDEAAVCVVLASQGYPGNYDVGIPITGVQEAESLPGVIVFHAGTAWRNNTLVTAGGRVMGVTALSNSIAAARNEAYAAVERINFAGMHYRRDIAHRAL